MTFSKNIYAATDEQKGLNIVKQVELHDRGWQDTTLKMVLRNKHGEKNIRLLRFRKLESPNHGDISLTIFDHPENVKGTVFLSFSHIANPNQQWIYLPTAKRVKRIASPNKSALFMDSEFSYEDLGSFEVEHYAYKYIKDDILDGKNCYVVENQPKYKHSAYTKQLVWIDKQRYIILKIDYYDRNNNLLKTLQFTNFKLYLSKFWRAHKQVMKNHQNGKITELTLSHFIFRRGFTNPGMNKILLKFQQ